MPRAVAQPETQPAAPPRALIRLDAGWLFLIPGAVLLGAAMLLPAGDALADARLQRDRMLAIEQHRLERLGRYEEYLRLLESADPVLYQSLAAQQLGLVPNDRRALATADAGRVTNASVFPALEPPPLVLPDRRRIDSTLQELASDSRGRLILIASAAICLFLGLLPPAKRRAGPPEPGGSAGDAEEPD